MFGRFVTSSGGVARRRVTVGRFVHQSSSSSSCLPTTRSIFLGKVRTIIPKNTPSRFCQSRWSSSGKELSRRERRALERKQRNQEKKQEQRQQKTTEDASSSTPFHRILQGFISIIHPKIVGSGRPATFEHLKHLFQRSFPLIGLVAVTTYLSEDNNGSSTGVWSPFSIRPSMGPSMLPTIQFLGDLWLIQHHFLHHQTGDVILWLDPATKRVSCKRIIGLPGDVVKRFGQYARLYQDDNTPKYGISWPSSIQQQKDKQEMTKWDPDFETNTGVDREFIVPGDHVWVEGDCPLFSLDSRQYGPIPISQVVGRLVLRVWPLTDSLYFQGLACRQSLWMRQNSRPVPFATAEEYLGRRFNFHRIPKKEANMDEEEGSSPSFLQDTR